MSLQSKELPTGFVQLIKSYGSPELVGLPDGLLGEPSVSIRYNLQKSAEKDIPAGDNVPWCLEGRYLRERPVFTLDPQFHQGVYYVQDASSMIIGYIVKVLLDKGNGKQISNPRPMIVLDACAAPGGKTTALIDNLPTGSTVIANEYVPSRASILKENLAKWGYERVKVTVGDTNKFTKYRNLFDLILVDAPCSGEGMMRKDEEAINQWSDRLIIQCYSRQKEILINVWESLKPGGYLIYSTCTFNRKENEEIGEWLISEYGAKNVAIKTETEWKLTKAVKSNIECMRFLPHKVRGEGLFVAVFQKPDEDNELSVSRKNKVKVNRKIKPIPDVIKNWLTEEFLWEEDETGNIYARFPSDGLPEDLIPKLRIGQKKGKDIIPSQELAMSRILNTEAFAKVTLSITDALSYLRGEPLHLPEGTPRGFVLLTYRDRPLGFVKNIGVRANNLYPDSWRIRNL